MDICKILSNKKNIMIDLTKNIIEPPKKKQKTIDKIKIIKDGYKIVFNKNINNNEIHSLGVDIGMVNLALSISNIDKNLIWFCLISKRNLTTIQFTDYLIEKFKDEDFQVLHFCKYFSIEQQCPTNPGARIVSLVLYSILKISFNKNNDKIISFVNGNFKYKILPMLNENITKFDPILHKGSKNRKRRKDLSIIQTKQYFKLNHFFNWVDYLQSENLLEKLDDLADSFIISLSSWVSKTKKEKQKKLFFKINI